MPHLCYALLAQQDGLIPQLVGKMNIENNALMQGIRIEIEKMPKVTGPGREADKIYVSAQADKVLSQSEKLAEQMQDEYVSVKHIFLGNFGEPGKRAKIGIQRI